MGPRHLARDKTQYLIWHAHLRQINRRRIQAAAHAEGHVLIAYELLVGQDLKQPTALRLLDIDRFIELIRQKESVLDQDIRNAFSEGFASRAHERAKPATPTCRPLAASL
jgi:hypothetical protein